VKRRLRWALCAFLGPLSLHGTELVPQDFAFGLPIIAEKEASAITGPSEVLGGPARLKPQVSALPRTQVALWGALLLAVAGLAWMASRLMREQKAA
jgi:hypothetical protein